MAGWARSAIVIINNNCVSMILAGSGRAVKFEMEACSAGRCQALGKIKYSSVFSLPSAAIRSIPGPQSTSVLNVSDISF